MPVRHMHWLSAALMFLIGVALIYCQRAVLSDIDDATPILWGEWNLSSLGVLLAALAPLLLVLRFLKAHGVDNASLGLLALSAIVSLHYIHISRNGIYTNDLYDHIYRIWYTMDNWFSPLGFSGWQDHHPPVYYYIAALVARAAEALEVIPELTALRFMSWASFLVFQAYNLLILRRAQFSGRIYYSCAALLMLWPMGLHTASKINPETLYYPLYCASFYHAVLWYQEGVNRHLRKAIILAAIAYTVRTNAIVLTLILAVMMVAALARGRSLRIKQDIVPWANTAIIVALCALISTVRLWAGKIYIVHYMGNYTRADIDHYLSYDYAYALTDPFISWMSRQGFLDYFLKTSIFGEYEWPSPDIALMLNWLLVVLVLFAAIPWLFSNRQDRSGLLPYAASLAVSLLLLIMFSQHVTHPAAQDVRYIYPILVCFVIMFGKSCLILKARGVGLLGFAAQTLAVCFGLLSVVFFWFNAR